MDHVPVSTLKSAPRIARLDDALINQIAAGEVVERPASVVKELIENSLDAGAERIDVSLTDGGMAEISVADDGIGMGREDLLLSVERHATSKIHEAADLEMISTYGFRGEALSSICSVSNVELRTRQKEASGGLLLEIPYGVPQEEPRPIGSPAGTFITVKDLFGRIPARKKFLKSIPTEFAHCSKVVRELALGNPHARFYLRHQGQGVREYVASTREARFREAFSVPWEPLIAREANNDATLEALLSPPQIVQDRGELFLFINGRGVRNRTLLSAVRSAYLDTLGPHHEPSGVVFLDMRPEWVDANVHPQKLEVRCLKESSWYPWVGGVVRKLISLNRGMREIVSEPAASYSPASSIPSQARSPSAPSLVSVLPVESSALRVKGVLPQVCMPAPKQDEFTALSQGPKEANSSDSVMRPRLKYLGQARASYLVCEDEAGVVFIDQHALHEKRRFESLLQQHREGVLGIQQMLVPMILRPPSDMLPLLEAYREDLHSVGFELEPFGDGDVAVKSRPAMLSEAKTREVLLEILESLRDSEVTDASAIDRALRPAFASIACHSVVRAGQTLSPQEAESLLENLHELEQGWTCPHGRPVILRMSYHTIEKHFERK